MKARRTPIAVAIGLAGLCLLPTVQADQGSDTVARLNQLYNCLLYTSPSPRD